MKRVQDDDDAAAFEDLYDRHASAAFSVARVICRDDGLAEDAVQDGFVSLWRGRSTYRAVPGSVFKSWALRTVRNRAIDIHRSRLAAKRAIHVPLEEHHMPVGASALDEVIRRNEDQELANLTDRLPAAQAQVINLAYFGGLTNTEIAAKLELPAGTVKGRMRLGLEKLRRATDAVR